MERLMKPAILAVQRCEQALRTVTEQQLIV
jgi:hypothetical protein